MKLLLVLLLVTGSVQAAPSTFTRAKAAADTAKNNALCTDIRPFYWEIGDKTGPQAGASLTTARKVVTSSDKLSIASASKWLYSTYYVQKHVLSLEDIIFFTFVSGYTVFTTCEQTDTVWSCPVRFREADYGHFEYSGGHMQKHAQINGLGAMDNAALAAEIRSQLGVTIAYNQPQPAGGAVISASSYAAVLRKILNRQMVMWQMLGTNSVPAGLPAPPDQTWRYSIGHWVEEDGTFSSAGAFGFYPWIDASKTYYGVVARTALGGAHESIYCGQVIRKAWTTGVQQ